MMLEMESTIALASADGICAGGGDAAEVDEDEDEEEARGFPDILLLVCLFRRGVVESESSLERLEVDAAFFLADS